MTDQKTTLCLSRKSGQAVIVGNARVEVEVVGRDRVKLRITAPAEVRILREELQTKESEQ